MTDKEAVASCMQCPAHPAMLESIHGNTRTLRWFVGTFLVVTIGSLGVFWTGYRMSAAVERRFEVYVGAQDEKLIRIERSIDRQEIVLRQIDDTLRGREHQRKE